MVATCVAEEGLDIGDVDLIICYDASASPIQMVNISPTKINEFSYKEWEGQVVNVKAE